MKRKVTVYRQQAGKLSPLCNTHYMSTQLGIVDCAVAEFKPADYKGLHHNTRKQNKAFARSTTN